MKKSMIFIEVLKKFHFNEHPFLFFPQVLPFFSQSPQHHGNGVRGTEITIRKDRAACHEQTVHETLIPVITEKKNSVCEVISLEPTNSTKDHSWELINFGFGENFVTCASIYLISLKKKYSFDVNGQDYLLRYNWEWIETGKLNNVWLGWMRLTLGKLLLFFLENDNSLYFFSFKVYGE